MKYIIPEGLLKHLLREIGEALMANNFDLIRGDIKTLHEHTDANFATLTQTIMNLDAKCEELQQQCNALKLELDIIKSDIEQSNVTGITVEHGPITN